MMCAATRFSRQLGSGVLFVLGSLAFAESEEPTKTINALINGLLEAEQAEVVLKLAGTTQDYYSDPATNTLEGEAPETVSNLGPGAIFFCAEGARSTSAWGSRPQVTGAPNFTLKAWITPQRLKHTFGVPFYCTITWGRRPQALVE